MELESDRNCVKIAGKVSQVSRLKYTPSGMPVLEATLASAQEAYGKETIGYFELIATGEIAEQMSLKLKIGLEISVEGNLFQRSYRNRTGSKVSETKIMIHKFGGKK